MIFASDNWAGASDKVAEALMVANAGAMPAYGTDAITKRLEQRLSALFERAVDVFLVPTGTAANVLSLMAFAPRWGAVMAHEEAHINTDECGALEFAGGNKIVGLKGKFGKLDAGDLAAALAATPGGVHHAKPSVLSLTQATEAGTVYSVAEVTALAGVAKSHGLAVHMDGARFANAVAALNVTPAQMTWGAGVDVLSFGATKGGCFLAEAIVLFDPSKREALDYGRKQAGHLMSKHRFTAAQFDAWLDDDHWLDLARHANAMAARLADGITASAGGRLGWARQANEVFAVLKKPSATALKAAGAQFYEWPAAALTGADALDADETLVRLVTSFRTQPADVDHFVAILG